MAERIRALDWRETSLGASARWPERLKGTVETILAGGFPAFVLGGPDMVLLYNDPALAIVESRHPKLLGLPAQEGWAELWEA